jgi:hypothetical protein|tara:strand:- start:239 stop:499 length:261 start_codon:yes stop_codon:yes gene_type:complete
MKYEILDYHLNFIKKVDESELKNFAVEKCLNDYEKNDVDSEFRDNYDFEKGLPKLINDFEAAVEIYYWDFSEDSSDIIYFKPIKEN